MPENYWPPRWANRHHLGKAATWKSRHRSYLQPLGSTWHKLVLHFTQECYLQPLGMQQDFQSWHIRSQLSKWCYNFISVLWASLWNTLWRAEGPKPNFFSLSKKLHLDSAQRKRESGEDKRKNRLKFTWQKKIYTQYAYAYNIVILYVK